MFVNFIVIVVCYSVVESAKILVVAPVPLRSHEVVFRPLIQELVNRDHEVTVITTDKVFPQGSSSNNLIEINLHELSYSLWSKIGHEFVNMDRSRLTKVKVAFSLLSKIFIEQLKDRSVVKLIGNTTINFDLLIISNCVPSTLIFSHIFKAPVIFMSTFGALPGNMKIIGSETHSLLYPTHYHEKLYNLTIWEKICELYTEILFNNAHADQEREDHRMLKGLFGVDTPTLDELKPNTHMAYFNIHPLWIHNQPVPPTAVYIWGINKSPGKVLPEELQSYLDSSKHGVIYMSFGSVFHTSEIPEETREIFIKVFSQLPYDILWKWDSDDLPGKSDNIKISKWFPQSDILKHPNLKLFITHGGLQSTNEAINAGVPLIGVPQFSDQEYNTQKYLFFKIGIKLDYTALTIENVNNAIRTIVINYDSYKKNINQLRELMYDQPKPVLEHATWWIEYILRHGGVLHLRSPAANMSWIEYYELETVLLLCSGLLVLVSTLLLTLYICLSSLWHVLKSITNRSKLPEKRK